MAGILKLLINLASYSIPQDTTIQLLNQYRKFETLR